MCSRLCAAVLSVALLLAGCGGSEEHATSSGDTAGSATTPAATSTQEDQSSGGGSDQAESATARFRILRGGRLSPKTVSVAASIPVRLTVRSKDSRKHELTLSGSPQITTLDIPARGRASMLAGALPPGSYDVSLDGHTAAEIVAKAG